MVTTHCEKCGKEITGYAYKYCDECYKKAKRKDVILGIMCMIGWAVITNLFRNSGIFLGAIPTVILAFPACYFIARNRKNFVKDLEDITSQFKNTYGIQVLYSRESGCAILKSGNAVIGNIYKDLKDDFHSKVNDCIEEYQFSNNKPFKKQFIVSGSKFDFRQHNLSTIYNGDASVKLKTKLSDYSPDKTVTVFINDLDIGYISYDDLKYFQKGNYNYRITNVNIKNNTDDNGEKTYKATITVAFSPVISQKNNEKSKENTDIKSTSLIICPSCNTPNHFEDGLCCLCRTPLFKETSESGITKDNIKNKKQLENHRLI